MENYRSKKRNRFHTDFKIAVNLNLIPKKELSGLPSSTVHKLKNTSPEEFADMIGLKYSTSFDMSNPDLADKINVIVKLAQYDKIIKLLKAALFVNNTINTILIASSDFYYKD
jgi:hypothetical protein